MQKSEWVIWFSFSISILWNVIYSLLTSLLDSMLEIYYKFEMLHYSSYITT